MRCFNTYMVLALVVLSGCDDGNKRKRTRAELDILKIENGALRSRVEALEAQVAQLAGLVESVQRFDRLSEVLYRNAEGDVVVDNANLRVINGLGRTHGETNGRGNIVVGYDEQREGDYPKTGSHNLVVGPRHAYAGAGGVVFGRDNAVDGEANSVLGGSGNAATDVNGEYTSASTVVGGSRNVASGAKAVVVGGLYNEAEAVASVVLGGRNNTAAYSHKVVLGGDASRSAPSLVSPVPCAGGGWCTDASVAE
jgi:hypothetical protein